MVGQKCWCLGLAASFVSGLYKLRGLGGRYQQLVKEIVQHDSGMDDSHLKEREAVLLKYVWGFKGILINQTRVTECPFPILLGNDIPLLIN